MKNALLLLVLLLAGCASGGARERNGFYERLDLALTEHNAARNARDYQRQSSVELELSRLTTPRYDWIARDAIEEADDDRRNLAVWALAFCRQPQAAEILRRSLDDEHPVVRASAAFALARQGPPDPPLEKIFAMLQDPRPFVRQGALVSLQTLLKPGEDHGRAAQLTGLLQDPSPDVRNEAAQVLGRLRLSSSLDPLSRNGLSDSAPLVRIHSAMALGNYGPGAASSLPWLVEALRDPETEVVEASWWALRRITGLDYDRSYYLWRDWFEQDQGRFEYVCPAHPDTPRQTAGPCPECGRHLERQPKAKGTRPVPGGTGAFVCPDHPEVAGGEGGKCGKCRTDLVPRK